MQKFLNLPNWVKGVIVSAFILPIIIYSRDRIAAIYVAPEKIETVEEAVKENTMIQRQLTDISQRQQTQIELQEVEVKHQKELNTLQIESLKELVKEIKKK